MSESQCYHYEFVCHNIKEFHDECGGPLPTVDSVHHALRSFCKKYVFQHEKSEAGHTHYQGRLQLIKKARGSIGASIAAAIGERVRFSVIPTVKENKEKEAFYCIKAQTKVAGPWTDQDYAAPVIKTRQMEEFESYNKFPWQTAILEISKQWDKRSIHVVIDKDGNNGKTDLAEWMDQEGLAIDVPPFRAMEDIMSACMCMPPAPCYLIDMPRAMKKEKLSDFFSGLECLKNGYLYDKRYHFKRKRINRPQVILFTNVKPLTKYLSLDRWRMWTINNKCLEVYKEYDPPV